MADSVTAFAPATVSNVACGFDILGFALSRPGDFVQARRSTTPGVAIEEITGDGGRLPRGADHNTAAVAVRALLTETGTPSGVALTLHKRMPISSGLGSSAASSVAALLAADELLQLGAPPELMLRCAMEGERAASGSAHPDNAAPSLFGGFVLIRGTTPPDVIRLPIPEGLTCAVLHPHMEIETRSARAALGDTVLLRDAVTQWGNVAGLVAGLFRSDYSLIARCLVDVVAEPKRAGKIPGFETVKQAALDSGALGCSLSGSGPALFALCPTNSVADRVGAAMSEVFRSRVGGECTLFVSEVQSNGARLVPPEEVPCDS